MNSFVRLAHVRSSLSRGLRFSLHAATSLLLLLAPGCAENDSPVDPGDEVSLVFEPAPGDLALRAFESIRLSVRRSDGGTVQAVFTVGADTVAVGSTYDWVADMQGTTVITATALLEGRQIVGEWRAAVTDDGALPTPAAVVPVATEGPLPGSIEFTWEPPPPSAYTIPPGSYVVGLSRQPIPPDDFGDAETTTVAHNPEAIRQRLVNEGLEEREVYYFRVRMIDTFGREAPLSSMASSEATGHYDVTGTLTAVRRFGETTPLANALVGIGDFKVTSGLDGRFNLTNVPDVLLTPLTIRDDSGFQFYSIETIPFSVEVEGRFLGVDQARDFALFERGDIEVVGPAGPRMDLLEFFRRITLTQEPFDPELWRWEQYPVPVHLYDLQVATSDTTDAPDAMVDYRAAFERAIETWNTATGQAVLVGVEDVSQALVEYTNDLGAQNALGRVRRFPEQGVPQTATVQVRAEFFSQRLADAIVAHELGHVLLLQHSDSLAHLMHLSVPAGTGTEFCAEGGCPTADEAYMVRITRALAQGQATSWFRTTLDP